MRHRPVEDRRGCSLGRIEHQQRLAKLVGMVRGQPSAVRQVGGRATGCEDQGAVGVGDVAPGAFGRIVRPPDKRRSPEWTLVQGVIGARSKTRVSNESADRLLAGNGHKARPRLQEIVILSTCNRLEVYAATNGPSQAGWRMIESFLVDLQGIPVDVLRPHLYFCEGEEAIDHLMNVACGLDSMILGEPQILDASVFGPGIHFTLADKRALKTVERGLSAAGIGDFQIEPIQPGLEDVYLSLIHPQNGGESL